MRPEAASNAERPAQKSASLIHDMNNGFMRAGPD